MINLDVLRRSLRVTTSRGFQISRDFVARAFRHAFDKNDVLAVWKMEENNVVYVTLRTQELADRLVSKGSVRHNQTPLYFEACDRRRITVRIHWLPYWLEVQEIVDFLEMYGAVKEINQDLDEGGIATGVWVAQVEMREGDQERLPYRHKFLDRVGLITFPGRKPLCFKCGEVGHIRADCMSHMRRPPPRRWETVSSRPIQAPKANNASEKVDPPPQAPDPLETPSSQEDDSQEGGDPPPSDATVIPPSVESSDPPEKRKNPPDDEEIRTEKRPRDEEETVSMEDIAPYQSLTVMLDAVSPSPGECEPSRAERKLPV